MKKANLLKSVFVSSCLCGFLLIGAGCIATTTGKSVTIVDPKQADAQFWMSKPATEKISAKDFYALWDACDDEVRSRFFRSIDKTTAWV